MKNKNQILSVLFTALAVTNLVTASESYDEKGRDGQGRTKLMNYIVQQEIELKTLDESINFYQGEVSRAAQERQELDNASTRKHKLEVKDKEYNESLIVKLKEAALGYDATLSETLNTINAMIEQGVDLAAKDRAGNTALSLCKTQQIYELLREKGAPFQFGPWMHYYRNEISTVKNVTKVAAVAAFLTAYVTTLLKKDALDIELLNLQQKEYNGYYRKPLTEEDEARKKYLQEGLYSNNLWNNIKFAYTEPARSNKENESEKEQAAKEQAA